VTNIFTDEHRTDVAGPVALTPQAADKGGPDSSDGGGVGVDFFLNLSATLGSLADTLSADREDREHERASHLPPSNEVLFKAGVFPTTGNLVLDMGSVPLGRVWQVRRLIVGGVTVTTTATGAASVFAQGAAPSDLNLTNCVDIFATLPFVQRYGTHQLFLIATEHLFVVVTSGTVGQQYAAAARVEDWHYGSYSQTYSAE
jgi:hypothetical protein